MRSPFYRYARAVVARTKKMKINNPCVTCITTEIRKLQT